MNWEERKWEGMAKGWGEVREKIDKTKWEIREKLNKMWNGTVEPDDAMEYDDDVGERECLVLHGRLGEWEEGRKGR